METVVVLMATYNGEKYLEEQITSILQQEDVQIKLVIRDDGSSDRTIALIHQFIETNDNILLLQGENVGSAKNFFLLAQNAVGEEGNYFAFADQDDIWYQDKMKSAIARLKEEKGPALYFSDLDLIDENGKKIGRKINKEHLINDKRCALVQNQATGCTMVFNREALEILTQHMPENVKMHDFWLFIVISFLGKVCYDSTPHMAYRQHGNNVVGAQKGLLARWKSRIKYIKYLKEHPREDMAKELLKGYKEWLSEQDVQLISKVAFYRESVKKRLGLLFDKEIRMEDIERDFWYRIRIILGDI